MMNKTHYNLIEYLLRHSQSITVKELSMWLNVSARTVKNYVKDINGTDQGTVISSGHAGYTIDRQKANALLANRQKQSDLPSTYEERAVYINRQFLTYHTDHIDLYSLSDSIGYGEDTIKADIVKMNKTYANLGVSYQISGDYIVLKADEQSLRKLARIILFENINENLIDIHTIKQVFSDIDIDIIKDTVERILRQQGLYINDFGMVNVILHIAITIRRLLNEKSLPSLNEGMQIDKSDTIYRVSEDIADQLNIYFEVPFNEEEIENIYLLIKANVNFGTALNEYEFHDYIGDELNGFVNELICAINDKYYINLDNDIFCFPFSMHIKNLLFRLQNHQRNINPVSEIIRQSYPIIFDIAVFIAHLIHERFGYKLDDNELAYLALHVGGEIERQNYSVEKVNAVLLCPNYLNMSSRLFSQIMINYSNELELIAVAEDADALKKYRYELLLSVVEVHPQSDVQVVLIPPLNIGQAHLRIQEAIETIKEKRRLKILKTDFDNFFSPDLFLINNGEYPSARAILQKCADTMRENGYVNEDFFEQILERELASTTAFPNIAIPHSLKLDAIKTNVCVMICPKSVRWADYDVRVILAVGVNKIDARRFGELYQALISLFDNEEVIEEIIRVDSFEGFRDFVKNLL